MVSKILKSTIFLNLINSLDFLVVEVAVVPVPEGQSLLSLVEVDT
jgi:hypothetical protein